MPLSVTLAPGKSSLVGKKIVAYERGYLDWEKPVHDSYGQASAGMYGMLPEFIDSLGGRFERSGDLAQADLADADVLLLIHPVHPWTPDRLERIWDFVRRGGSLLVVAETMLQEDDLASSFNEVLEPTGMKVRFDVATPSTWNWQDSSTAVAHPAVAALGDERNRFGLARGPSIRTPWPARPILVGRWGWSDPGHDAVWTDAYRYDAGERLGDLVLAAERPFGSGTVVALSGNSSLTNLGNVNSYVFTGRLLAYLAGQSANPQTAWRQVAGMIGCLSLLGLIACPAVAGRLAGVAVVLALVLAGSRTFGHLSTEVLPDGRQHAPFNNVAYIDASHLEAYADGGWGFDGVAGLALTLMRNGYQPFLLPEVTGRRLQRAGMLISIAPARPFSAGERATVRQFVERGGIFIATAGAEKAGPIQPLLDEFDLRVPRSPVRPTGKDREPDPMGHLTTLYRPPGADYDAGMLLYTGWPIECDPSQRVVLGFENRPLVALAEVDDGNVVLVGDTAFAMNKNLEYVGGQSFYGRHDNAHFWRWLITRLTPQDDWLPPAKARSNAEPAAEEADVDSPNASRKPPEDEAVFGDPLEQMTIEEVAR